MMRHSLFLLALVTLCISLAAVAGCFNPLGKGTPESTRFYVLHSLHSQETLPQVKPAEDAVAIGIGPVKIPQYLKRPQIVTRTSRNELEMAEFDKWAEPLEENFSRVLAENLAILLATDRIFSYPWKRDTPVDYQVAVEVSRFDAEARGNALLRGRWTLFGGPNQDVLLIRSMNFTEPTPKEDYRALVETLSRILEDLSREIAGAIKAP